jgi:hypothetical protein
MISCNFLYYFFFIIFFRTRTGICREQQSPNNQVPDSNCQALQPKVTSCTNCCNTEACAWEYTPWTPCSAYCGSGTNKFIQYNYLQHNYNYK